ncbi:uncharacterized protein LOC142340955 [Convolutriloba macropyga]|uniref:uncharacterized protein LOC142340955 n=1 Tax=Convolutriloba macropyga TaxID=536237 RepID=UPI003F52534A
MMTQSKKGQPVLVPLRNNHSKLLAPAAAQTISGSLFKRLQNNSNSFINTCSVRKLVSIPTSRQETFAIHNNHKTQIELQDHSETDLIPTTELSTDSRVNQALSDAHDEVVSDLTMGLHNEEIVLQETVVPYESEDVSTIDNQILSGSANQGKCEIITSSSYNLRHKIPRKYDAYDADIEQSFNELSSAKSYLSTISNANKEWKRRESFCEPSPKKSKLTEDEDFDMCEFFKDENENSGDESQVSKRKSISAGPDVKTSESVSSMLSIPDETLFCDSNVNKLSVKLVKLLRDSPEGVLDLKTIVSCLNPKNKRRMYDIVNVLSGVGLIEKEFNSSVLIWKGGGPFSNSRDVKQKLAEVRRENERLEILEKTLEQHRFCMEQSLKNLVDDLSAEELLYVSQGRIASCFGSNQTVIAIEGSPGTKIQCPNLTHCDDQTQFELRITSKTKSIKAKLMQPFGGTNLNHFPTVPSFSGEHNLAGSYVELTPAPSHTDYRLALDDSETLFDLYC